MAYYNSDGFLSGLSLEYTDQDEPSKKDIRTFGETSSSNIECIVLEDSTWISGFAVGLLPLNEHKRPSRSGITSIRVS